MTSPLPAISPYVTPAMLIAAPTGISWSTIPPGAGITPAQRTIAQYTLCAEATADVNSYCNQPLKCILSTEVQRGPNYYITVDNTTGEGRFITSRGPILTVTAVKVAQAAVYPRQWVTVPAGNFEPDVPLIGVGDPSLAPSSTSGSQTIRIAPGFVSWVNGRNGCLVSVTYYSGWPHTSLSADVTAGTSIVAVEDCTGWAVTEPLTGASNVTGTVYDPSNQEISTVIATSVASGPGTLTLAAPLAYAHPTGTLISSMSPSVIWATILLASAKALTRGATATVVQATPGAGTSGAGGAKAADFTSQAHTLLNPYKRVI